MGTGCLYDTKCFTIRFGILRFVVDKMAGTMELAFLVSITVCQTSIFIEQIFTNDINTGLAKHRGRAGSISASFRKVQDSNLSWQTANSKNIIWFSSDATRNLKDKT